MDGFTQDRGVFDEPISGLSLPVYSEVIHQRGEIGLLDGDALLMWAASRDVMDKGRQHGGQMLHLVELVECLLLRFLRRNVRVHIVFAEEGNWLWSRSSGPFLRVARRVLIAHLRGIEMVEVHTPRSQRSVEWMEDKVPLIDCGWVLLVDQSHCEDEAVRNYWEEASRLYCASMQIPVVYIDDAEFRGNDFFAFSVTPSRFKRKELPLVDWEGVRDQGQIECACADDAIRSALERVRHQVDPRVLSAIQSSWDKCKALPLEERFVDPGEPDGLVVDGIKLFLEALHPFASVADLVDCIDGRRVHAEMGRDHATRIVDTNNNTNNVDDRVRPALVDINNNNNVVREETRSVPYTPHSYHRTCERKTIVLSAGPVSRQKDSKKGPRQKYSPAEQEVLENSYLSEKMKGDRIDFMRKQDLQYKEKSAQRAEAGSTKVYDALARSMLGPNVEKYVIPRDAITKRKPDHSAFVEPVVGCECPGCSSIRIHPAAEVDGTSTVVVSTPPPPPPPAALPEVTNVAEPVILVDDWMSLDGQDDIPIVLGSAAEGQKAAPDVPTLHWDDMTKEDDINNDNNIVVQKASTTATRPANRVPESSKERKKAPKQKEPTHQVNDDVKDLKDLKAWESFAKVVGKTVRELLDYVAARNLSPHVRFLCYKYILEKVEKKEDAWEPLMKLMVLMESVSVQDQEAIRASAIPVFERHGYPRLAERLRSRNNMNDVDEKWIQDSLLLHSCDLPRASGLPDSRVRAFNPDEWQRQLLDVVDQGRSAVVVAPTSAGKTFIQYYAMEKVLRADDDGVVVYVCPTKALCNQVLAGATARFEKNYPHPGRVVCGLFTRDERRNEDKCQILVTVPQCLEILLLSPTDEAQKWVKQIRWTIFDEVHSLNEPSHGGVWERLLQLTTSPFLALSATVGKPEIFTRWLSLSRNKESNESKPSVECITYDERYNDLRMWVVAATKRDGQKAAAAISKERIPPLALVSIAHLRAHGCPPLADFESSDAWDLFQRMSNEDAVAMKDLHPLQVFQSPVITRSGAKEWAKKLVNRLVEWATKHEESAACANVLKYFHDKLFLEHEVWLPKNRDEEKEKVFELASELRKDGPILCFSFYRAQCEDMVGYIARRLSSEQEGAISSLVKSVPKCPKFYTTKKDQDEALKSGDAVIILNHGIECVAPVGNAKLYEDPKYEPYHADYCWRAKLNSGEVDRNDIIEDCKWKTRWDENHPLIQGLRRGIGCHHGGLPHRYRVAVELLLRKGDLLLVFATATLAQGIHAPARSVMILRDSPFLNPTSFRQMSGRAGRRGYDPVGNCVFVGVTQARIRSLLGSQVPLIRGGSPLNVSMVLRLQMLCNFNREQKRQASEVAMRVHQIIHTPLLSNKMVGLSPNALSYLQHYYDFGKELLQDLGVLNTQGRPVWLAAIGAHLGWMDPHNLALLYFFDREVLNTLMEGGSYTDDAVQMKLLVYLTAIMAPSAVHPRVLKEWKPESSMLFLDTPPVVVETLKKFNDRVLRLFLDRPVNFAQSKCLPLSRKRIGGGGGGDAVASTGCISLFARTSGVSEASIRTVDDAVLALRDDLFVDHGSIPAVKILRKFNSFIVDFYKMEKPNSDHISYDNQIKDAWQRIEDFSLNLRVISVALAKLHGNDQQLDWNLFRMIKLIDKESPAEPPGLVTNEEMSLQEKVVAALWHLSRNFRGKHHSTKH